MHHEECSFFRAEKALPIAFVRPRGGGGMYTREESEGKFFRVADLLGAEVLGGGGGAARVHRARGEQVIVIKAGGEEKPEREEVVEPLEEPTPERYKERREKVPEEEPEKVPA